MHSKDEVQFIFIEYYSEAILLSNAYFQNTMSWPTKDIPILK